MSMQMRAIFFFRPKSLISVQWKFMEVCFIKSDTMEGLSGNEHLNAHLQFQK